MLIIQLPIHNLGQENPVPVAIIAAATSITLYGIYTTFWAKKFHEESRAKKLQDMPSPSMGLPYFGHIFQCSDDLPGLKFHKWHKKYGPMFRVKMGIKDWVIIGDPVIAKEIFLTNSAVTAGRPFHSFMTEYYALNQRGMTFTNPDKRWKRSRAAASNILSSKALNKFTEHIEYEISRATNHLIKISNNVGKVDVIQQVQLMTTNIFMQTCFGKRATSVDDPLFQAIVHSIDTTLMLGAPVNDLATFLPAFKRVFEFMMPIEKPMMEFIYKKRNPLYRHLIREALESGSPCIVTDIYSRKEELGFEDDDIMLFIADVINAGSDVTAMALCWILIILCNHKSWQQKIQSELDAFIEKHKRLPTFDERENFPILIATQKECIRFRPSNHIGLPHETTADMEYGGFFFPKGTILVSNTYTLNLNANEYQSPEEFLPERYMDDISMLSTSVNSKTGRDHFMFGWGRRLCPGVDLADVIMFNFMVGVLATTTIEPPLNDKGMPTYPDVHSLRNGGLVVAPAQSVLQFVERPDRLI
ncbi:cytochrome P450 [Fennellomyces sp. T-0311]|nr:cytochrome P450 [Fennellomyces sp. T-0311]